MAPSIKRWAGYLLVFVVGFIAGVELFVLFVRYADRTGQAVALPHWWRFWLFDANPIVFVVCDLMQYQRLCIGRFDGGPLEWAEDAWLLFAQGTPFGIAAVLALRLFARRRRGSQRSADGRPPPAM